MDLEYSHHAEKRMDEQGITTAMVEGVLLDPQWMPPTSRSARYDAMTNDRRLCVVVQEDRDIPIVVTAFWHIEEMN